MRDLKPPAADMLSESMKQLRQRVEQLGGRGEKNGRAKTQRDAKDAKPLVSLAFLAGSWRSLRDLGVLCANVLSRNRQELVTRTQSPTSCRPLATQAPEKKALPAGRATAVTFGVTPGFSLNLPSGGPIPTAGLFVGGLVSTSQTVSGEFLELLAPLLGAPLEQNAPPAGSAAAKTSMVTARGDSDSQEKKPQKNESDNQQPAAPIASFVTPTPILPNPLGFTLWTASPAPEPLAQQKSGSDDLPSDGGGSAAPAASSPACPADKIAAMPAVNLSYLGSETVSASAEGPELEGEQQAEFLVDKAPDSTDSGANPASGETSGSGVAERPPAGLAFGARLIPVEDNQEQAAPAQPYAPAAKAAPPAYGAELGLPRVRALETADSRRQLPQAPAADSTEPGPPRVTALKTADSQPERPPTPAADSAEPGPPRMRALETADSRRQLLQVAAADSTELELPRAIARKTADSQPELPQTPPADGAELGLPRVTALGISDSPRQIPQAPAGGLAEMSNQASDGTPGRESQAAPETGQPRIIPPSSSSTWASAQEPPTGAPLQPVLSRIVTGSPAAGDSVSGSPAASPVKSEQSPSQGFETKTAAAQPRDLAGNHTQSVDFATDSGATARRPALPDSPAFAKLAVLAASRTTQQPLQPAAGEVSSQAADGTTAETGQPSAMPSSDSSARSSAQAPPASTPAQQVLSRMATGGPATLDSVGSGPVAAQVKGERPPTLESEAQAAPTVDTRGQRENRAQLAGAQTESGAAAPATVANPASQTVPPAEPGVQAPPAPASAPRTPAKADSAPGSGATVPEAVPPADRTTAAKAAPANEISLSVPGRNQDGVQVRVVERAGEVHVTVRTPDGELARDLRQDLSQLVTRLEQKGYQTETWRPSGHADTLSQVRQPQRGADSENPSGNSGGAQDQSGGRRGSSQQQKERSKWLQEMGQTFGDGQ